MRSIEDKTTKLTVMCKLYNCNSYFTKKCKQNLEDGGSGRV